MISSQRKTTETHKSPQNVGFLLVLVALAFSLFAALGIWQMERRAWKLDLIARVDQRAHADAVVAPSSQQWTQLNASNDEYRRIRVTGKFTDTPDTLVQAVTKLGSGFWILSPLRLEDGSLVMVNRGFVPTEAINRIAKPFTADNYTSTVTGLLRMTQPDGAFLRKNDPTNRRWYSRDVQAIAKFHSLEKVAPYFIDADTYLIPSKNTEKITPIGGLTVTTFQNNHLIYALTWFTLATMLAGITIYLINAFKKNRTLVDRKHLHSSVN